MAECVKENYFALDLFCFFFFLLYNVLVLPIKTTRTTIIINLSCLTEKPQLVASAGVRGLKRVPSKGPREANAHI